MFNDIGSWLWKCSHCVLIVPLLTCWPTSFCQCRYTAALFHLDPGERNRRGSPALEDPFPRWQAGRRCPAQEVQPDRKGCQREGGGHWQVHLQRVPAARVQRLRHDDRRLPLWGFLWSEPAGFEIFLMWHFVSFWRKLLDTCSIR